MLGCYNETITKKKKDLTEEQVLLRTTWQLLQKCNDSYYDQEVDAEFVPEA